MTAGDDQNFAMIVKNNHIISMTAEDDDDVS